MWESHLELQLRLNLNFLSHNHFVFHLEHISLKHYNVCSPKVSKVNFQFLQAQKIEIFYCKSIKQKRLQFMYKICAMTKKHCFQSTFVTQCFIRHGICPIKTNKTFFFIYKFLSSWPNLFNKIADSREGTFTDKKK